ncbi:MAG TPA: hypothetical protein VI968_01110 [archaeon]|nr:hypothetical protein [archaeon]
MSCYENRGPKYSGMASSGYGRESNSYAFATKKASYHVPDRSLGTYEMHAMSKNGLGVMEVDDSGLPVYPSYLGIPITEPLLRSDLLGQTNGRKINITSDVDPQVKNFVLMHEEEHIKDMNASEWDVDKRAVQRLIRSKKPVSWIKVKLLLRSRWHEKADLLLSDETAAELACRL